MYMVFKNNVPYNSYRTIPYAVLGIDAASSPSPETLASLECYEFVDSGIPDHDHRLYCPKENWTIQGNTATRFWTFENQNQEESWAYIREIRDRLLSESDWSQVSDVPMSEEKKSEWKVYRQKLRDITEDFQTAQSAVLPSKPQ